MTTVVSPSIQNFDDEFTSKTTPLVVDRVELHRETGIVLFGKEVNISGLVISVIGIAIAIYLWYKLDLLKDNVSIGFLVIIISNLLLQIFTTSVYSGSISLEQNKLTFAEQVNTAMLGSILVFIFIAGSKNLNNKSIRLAAICVIISLVNALYIGVHLQGNAIGTLRKIKEMIININLMLFANAVYLSMS